MIANLYADESPAARMLDLIARKAPLFMRVGGGALAQEDDRERHAPHRLSPEMRARAIELGRTGRYTATDIARQVGSTQSAVFKALAREGIKAPDGRTLERRRRATA